MHLGPFSLSLSVKDIAQSLSFYERLGFKVIDGGHINSDYPDNETSRWRVLTHESVKIGLFQGMFKANILTFYPEDVRQIQGVLKKANVKLMQEADEQTSDPASILLEDPDGNLLMFDQF